MSQRSTLRSATRAPPTQHHALTPAQAAGARARVRAALFETLSADEQQRVHAALLALDEVDERIAHWWHDSDEPTHALRMQTRRRGGDARLHPIFAGLNALKMQKAALEYEANALLEAKLSPGTPANEYGWALQEQRRRHAFEHWGR